MPDLLPNFQPGDEWTADVVNQLIDRLNNPDFDVRTGEGLYSRKGVRGQVQIAASSGLYIFKGKTSAITARTSDADHGSGTVEIWVKDPSSGQYVDSGNQVDVDYISSTTGGLPSGTWVNCAYQEDGTAEIISVDCGN